MKAACSPQKEECFLFVYLLPNKQSKNKHTYTQGEYPVGVLIP